MGEDHVAEDTDELAEGTVMVGEEGHGVEDTDQFAEGTGRVVGEGSDGWWGVVSSSKW